MNKQNKKDCKTIVTGGLSNPLVDYDKYCIESKFIDKKTYRLSIDELEKMYKKALKIGKKSFLILTFKINEKENFILHCDIQKHKQ